MANIQHMSSKDLVHWSPVTEALPRLPEWGSPNATWAPEVLRRGSQYVLYTAVPDPAMHGQCISAATAPNAAGPFTDTSHAPLVCKGGVATIDPSPFVAPNGDAYLLWAASGVIYAQSLRSDGRALTGAPVRLLAADRAWEGTNIEAPSMVRGPLGYYLFYSGSDWRTARYAVGYAVCRTPMGGCTKVTTRAPWLSSDSNAAGPGGQSFFRDATGALRMAYHAWSPGKVGYQTGGVRSLWVARLVFGSTGSPQLMP